MLTIQTVGSGIWLHILLTIVSKYKSILTEKLGFECDYSIKEILNQNVPIIM